MYTSNSLFVFYFILLDILILKLLLNFVKLKSFKNVLVTIVFVGVTAGLKVWLKVELEFVRGRIEDGREYAVNMPNCWFESTAI